MNTADAPNWTGPGNDYRGILELDPSIEPRVAVVIVGPGPAFDPAGLGSVERSRVEIVTAAGMSTVEIPDGIDVVAFLGPNDVPTPSWLESHLRWHNRAGNVVVIGPNADPASNRVIRGSRQLIGNDEAFACLTSTNISLPASLARNLDAIDPVTGWRLWNEGCFLAYDPEARLSADTAGPLAGQPSRDQPLLLEDAIPHRRYRPVPSAFHDTPKVSWIVAAATSVEADAAWEACRRSSFSDHEFILHGPPGAIGEYAEVAKNNPRVTVVAGGEESFAGAVAVARGELIAILDARAGVAAEILPKALARFEAKPSSPIVRVGYEMAGGRYLRLEDLAAVDDAMGRNGLPLFALVTRRELAKDPKSLESPATAWQVVLSRCEQSLVVSPLVRLSANAPFEPHLPGLAEIGALGVREVAREAVRRARRTTQVATRDLTEPVPPADSELVSVAYVGFTGHANLGDEAVRVAIERLMPWATFEAEPADPQLLMVGGGTLINGRRYYLNRMLRQESDSIERALFGTGVRSPEYWGVTEPMEDWFSFIDSSLYAAVRGPDSVRNLRTLGYRRGLPIIGDPALFLEPPADTPSVGGRVVVCPVFTNGNLHGGSDDEVFDTLARLIQRLRAEGRDVVMLSAFPQDDRWVIDIMRRAASPDLPYVAGYADIDDTMALLASADLVVGERLHAAIMAAAAGTPFVAIEYRPKLRDFARSVDQEATVVRTDEMDRLESVFDEVWARRETHAGELADRVGNYRSLQRDGADELRDRFLAR